VVVESPPSIDSDLPALGLEAPEQLDDGKDMELDPEPNIVSAEGLLYESGTGAGTL
jgi:hypothetical protein